MKNAILTITLLFSFATYAQVVEVELIDHLTVDDVENVLTDFGLPVDFLPIEYEVDFYQVHYMTLHPNGDSVMVSGALCLPTGITCPLPLSSYQHGTIGKKVDAPSTGGTEVNLGILYASVGYAITLPDYIGLGTSEGMHLYVHAESEASASLDLIRAAYDLQEELDYLLDDQLFIWGYSQGGHATAALQRMIEVDFPEEFNLTASAPMSGPYDISGSQAEVITSDEAYPTPGYLPYVVLSYQEVYGTLYDDLYEVFLPEYADIIPGLFDGTHSMGEINSNFPDVPNQMLLPEVLEEFENDPNHPIRIALADNDLLDWAPEVPTNIYYCEGDDQVTYLNSLVAYDAYVANGSTSVNIFDGGDHDHGDCAPLAMLAGFNFFEDLKEPAFSPVVTLTPTDASDVFTDDGSISIEVENPGNWTYEWSNGSTDMDLDNIPVGFYILTITNELGCTASFSAAVGVVTNIESVKSSAINWYPNPAENSIVVESREAGHAVIVDTRGQTLMSFHLPNGQSAVDLSELAVGFYVIQFENGEAHRLVINR